MERIVYILAVVVVFSSAQICRDDSCGINARCFPIRGEARCFCREGLTGNPYVKCYNMSDCNCWGDPHCKTFDGTYYDYQGTCPYVYSKPCDEKLKANPNLYYEVKAKNKHFYPNSPVTYVSEIEVLMHDQLLHVDEKLQFQVNGFVTPLPFYYPTKLEPKVVAERRGGQVHIRNENFVQVVFFKSFIKMVIPHMDEYVGRDGICGLAGNLNKNCTDDMISKDGTGITRTPCIYPIDKKSLTDLSKVLDTWTTDDFQGFDRKTDKCRNGQGITPDLPECDTAASSKLCLPLKQAQEGTGPFAACKAMGEEALKMAYESCTFDLCFIKDGKCNTFNEFVTACQSKLGKVELPKWRDETKCPMKCGANMKYNSCISGCQSTCADPIAAEQCDKPCYEGCECNKGFLLDNSAETAKCVTPKQCPCFDAQGGPREKEHFWYTDNCKKGSICVEGSIEVEDTKCPEHGHCGRDPAGKMDCLCDEGFKKASGDKCVPK